MLEVADPDRDGDARAGPGEIYPDQLVGTPRHRLRRLGGGLGEQDGELVASDPCHEIGGARDGCQPRGDLSQHRVAGLVAELIVHVLEPVDIQQGERQRTAVSLRALDLRCQPYVKRAMVREPGQRIGIRLALEALRRALRLREHDLEVTDSRLELMLAPALAIFARVFEVRVRYDTHCDFGCRYELGALPPERRRTAKPTATMQRPRPRRTIRLIPVNGSEPPAVSPRTSTLPPYWSDAGFVLAASADPDPPPRSASTAATGAATVSRITAQLTAEAAVVGRA